MSDDAPRGEETDVTPAIWAQQLDAQAQLARSMGVEAHTRITDTEGREHAIELTGDVESAEEVEGGHTRIWLRNAGIVTVTGAAIVAALAIVRHRRRRSSEG